MQSTIYFLQQELRKARESVSLLQQENNAFKSMSSSGASPLTVPPQPPPQVSPPQPPPPTSIDNNGHLNGVAGLVPKVATSNDDNEMKFDARLSGDTKIADEIKSEGDVHNERDRCGEGSGKREPTAAPTASSFLSGYETKSESPETGRRRLDEPDESSNDSAALIIKVENEELSDREEDEEDGAAAAAAAAAVAVAAQSEVRGAQKQTRRSIRDRTIIKNESVVDNRSNGGDNRSSSRPASRRLLRERTTKRDKSAAESDDERPLHKKKRRESILSLDYTETDDDAILLTNGETIQSDPEDGP